jgi:lysyl-tRNA synthetase, class II
MDPITAPQPFALRMAPTRAARGRVTRAVTRGAALAVAALGAWHVVAVENGALGTLAGAGLIGIAPSLSRGRTRAHRWACLLTATLAVTALHGSPGRPGWIAATAALGLLVAGTQAFQVLGDPSTRGLAHAAWGLAALATAADVAHARGALGHPLVATIACASIFLVLRSLRPWRPSGPATAEERARAAWLIGRYGTDTLAPFALRPDKRYFFHASGDAFLAYGVVAGVAIVSGDPVGRAELLPALLADFDRHARTRGWVPAAVGVGVESLRDWRALGYRAHYTGDEAVVDPAAFSLEGRAVRKVRQSVTRLVREGYRVELRRAHEIDAGLEHTIDAIADDWREGRGETGFSMAFASAHVDRARDDLYAIAFDAEGRARGFLHFAVVPVARALSLSSMRRDRSTPNGLNEFLICRSLAWARDEGFTRVSLNFAAFAKVLDPPSTLDRIAAAERRALRRLSGTFQLERLLAFNRKFEPEWVSRYAVYPSTVALPRIALAVMLAEAYVVLPAWMRM